MEWTIQVPDKTDRSVRKYLAYSGIDLSTLVDEAVRAEVLRRTIRDIQAAQGDLSPEDADALADEAVAWARKHRT